MKKGTFGILTALLALSMVFTMVSCGDGDDGGNGGSTTYKITFNPDDGGANAVPSPITVVKGRAVGTLPADLTKTGAEFDGWWIGTTEIFASYVPTGNVTLKAGWFATSTAAVRVKSGVGTSVNVPIEFGTDTWNDVKASTEGTTAFARPKWTDSSKEFVGWYDKDGVRYDTLSTFDGTTPLDEGFVLTAKWGSTAITAPGAVLKLASENASVAIFEFVLPAGKTAADYASLSADFAVPETSLAKQIRCFRLMGPYSLVSYKGQTGGQTMDKWTADQWTGDFVTDTNGLKVARFDPENASAIAHDKGFAWGYNWAGVQGKTGDDPAAANEWFTVTYPFGDTTGANPNTGFNTDRLTSGGTIYFGIGIAGVPVDFTGSDKTKEVSDYYNAVVQVFKDVKLIGKTGTADVAGTPGVNNGKPMGAGYVDPIYYTWIGAPSAAIVPPVQEPFDCECDPEDVHVDPCACGGQDCACVVAKCTDDDCAIFGMTKAEALAAGTYCDADDVADHCAVCQAVGTGPVQVTEHDFTVALVGNVTNNKGDDVRTLLTLTSGVVSVSATASDYNQNDGQWGGGGFTIDLPATWNNYTSIKVDYDFTKTTTVGKVTVKQGYDDMATDISGGGQYQDLPASGTSGSFTFMTTQFSSAEKMASPGITFQVNNWSSSDVPQTWTLTVTKVTLTP